jgi:hypothetical protein
MDIWKAVVELNNARVALLLQNKDREALPLFTESLYLIKTILNAQQRGPESNAPTMQRSRQHAATHALDNLQHEHWFLWNEVFTISDPAGATEKCLTLESEWKILLCASMIIVNVALIHHRQSRLGKRSCLAKAETMHKTVATLLGCASQNQGTAVIVKLATLNNLSLIHHEQNNVDASCRGFGHLVCGPSSRRPPSFHMPPRSM